MYRCIVVDDEEHARNGLSKIIETYTTQLQVVGKADSAESGIALIRALKPDLIFLDVDMPGGNGFQLLNAFDAPEFEVIFVTAYDQYALKAIKHAALDYLMKPVDLEELIDAVERFKKKRPGEQQKLSMLKQELQSGTLKRLAISTQEGLEFVNIENIVMLSSEGSYTAIKCEKGNTVLASKNLGEFETLLSEKDFFRVHHSHIINLNKVAKYLKGRGGAVVMTNGAEVDVSTRRKDSFLERLGGR